MKTIFHHRSKGVTLMEILVVVAIIGIIAGISVPSFLALLANNRTRSSTMTLMSAIRRTRSRAISLNRQLRMEIDTENFTYTVTRSPYVVYDPLSVAMAESPLKKLIDEPAISVTEPYHEMLEQDIPFNANDGIEDILATVGTGTTHQTSLSVTFNPTGVITIMGGTYATIMLEGQYIAFTIRVYKGGQVNLHERVR